MYKSVHEYLDKHLGTNPSDTEIKQCKKAYWKWYRKQHRQKRVAKAKALNLTIPLELWNNLKVRASASGMDVYDFIKRHLKSGVESTLEMDRAITIQLMQCLEHIKDYMHGDISIETLHTALERIILKL